jgi:putative heme-binding domain-containing protein
MRGFVIWLVGTHTNPKRKRGIVGVTLLPRLRFGLVLVALTANVSFAQSLQDQLAAEGAAALARAARAEGNAQRGAIVFHQPYLACAKCHTLGEKEETLGPNLAKIGKDLTPKQLVESVLEPSKIIRKGFETVTVETTSGDVISGLVIEETAKQLVLREATAESRLRKIPIGEIERRSAAKTSLMPAGQVNQLGGRQPFLDLARYLMEIAEGGPERAKQLEPPPSLFAHVLPEYEKQIDHAGMIASLDDKAAKRGEAIYNRLCVNCHGTREQPGSLPTSLKFAEGKFKNGHDPFRMYQTLTHGFGLMTPQTWMVPQQKYDVVHYIREEYLKKSNPAQHFAVTPEYLAGLPKGTTRGPAPTNIEPWATMNYGPFLAATYEIGKDGSNIAHKGIAIRLDPGPGGVSRGKHWYLFEHDTLRAAAAWRAEPSAAKDGPSFIDWEGINFNGKHQVHPHVVGQVQFSNPTGPGWANPETGKFDDPRQLGRDGKRYGPLPREWGKFRGFYQHGEKVVLSYTVGETQILEMPGMIAEPGQLPTEPDAKATKSESTVKFEDPIYTRTFQIGPRAGGLRLQVAQIPVDANLVKSITHKADDKQPGRAWLLDKKYRDGNLAVGISRGIPSAEIKLATPGALDLVLPAGSESLSFVLSLQKSAAILPRTERLCSQPAEDLSALTRGSPRRWSETLETEVLFGANDRPYAVDVFTLPTNNPWFCQLRLTGFDFFADGDRMAVCSWDGDVWIVSGLSKLPKESPPAGAPRTKLSWRRIASGLFQPLGLKIVKEQIYVSCRDQIVRLQDLNGDGETDFYECFNSDHQVTEHFHEFAMGLQTDAAGSFYYAKSARHALPAVVPHHGTLLKVSPDGAKTEILATGFRAANGVCLNPDGSFVVTDQEGHWNPKNRINWVKPGGFYGNMFGYHGVTDSSDSAMQQPLCWITNTFDRSPAELLWVRSDKWGPLAGSLLNLSYGYGKVFIVPHEEIGGQMQGGMCELPIPPLPTGVMRGRFHPNDGQLYTCGMFAWGGNATQPGSFYRIRYTGRPVYLPARLRAKRGGLEMEFTAPLAEEPAKDAAKYVVKTWSLNRTANYGSPHFDERTLKVSGVELSDDRRKVRLTIPEIKPTWCMSVEYKLRGHKGEPVVGLIHSTIHTLGE